MPFIRKVHVLFKTRLIFSRINGPIIHGMRPVGRKHLSIDLNMFFIEYPVRLISAAVFMAVV